MTTCFTARLTNILQNVFVSRVKLTSLLTAVLFFFEHPRNRTARLTVYLISPEEKRTI